MNRKVTPKSGYTFVRMNSRGLTNKSKVGKTDQNFEQAVHSLQFHNTEPQEFSGAEFYVRYYDLEAKFIFLAF